MAEERILQNNNGEVGKPTRKRKRKGNRRRKPIKAEDDDSDLSSQSDGEPIQQTASTARRVLWQRGHAAFLPSVKRQIIEDATVDCVADALTPLCEFGFAIVNNVNEAFHPKHRLTREQRDFIHKCTSPYTDPYCSRRYPTPIHAV